jgi:hypothetical protein
MSSALSDDELLKAVHDAYSTKAKLEAGANVDCACETCSQTVGYQVPESSLLDSKMVAQAFGYTAEELQSIPTESHMGLSCGNPVAAAHIKEVCETDNAEDLSVG